MTGWGTVLIIAFVVLGLSPLRFRKAVRAAVWLSVAVVVAVGLGAL